MSLSSATKQFRASGFTLLEVMIAMVILAFISIGIYQAITHTFMLRESLSVEGDFYNSIRLTMGVLGRDIISIYNPMMILPQKTGTQTADQQHDVEQALLGSLGQATPFWGISGEKVGVRPSRFVGSDTKMTFVSVSHLRFYKGTLESEFAKIGYELGQDPGNKDNPGTTVLIKTENTNAFDEQDAPDSSQDRYLKTFPLLHGVKKLKFRYYKKDKDGGDTGVWWNSWDTEKEDTKNYYPDLIEVQVEVVGPARLDFEGRFVFRPEMPLNGLNPST